MPGKPFQAITAAHKKTIEKMKKNKDVDECTLRCLRAHLRHGKSMAQAKKLAFDPVGKKTRETRRQRRTTQRLAKKMAQVQAEKATRVEPVDDGASLDAVSSGTSSLTASASSSQDSE